MTSEPGSGQNTELLRSLVDLHVLAGQGAHEALSARAEQARAALDALDEPAEIVEPVRVTIGEFAGIAHVGLGRYEEALEQFQQSVVYWSVPDGQHPLGHARALLNRAAALEGLGRFAAAEADYRSALALCDANPDTQLAGVRGMAHAHLADMQVLRGQAVAAPDVALMHATADWPSTIGPQGRLAQRNASGVLALAAGRIDEAISTLESVRRDAAGNSNDEVRGAIESNLGLAYLHAGRVDEAAEHLEAASEAHRACGALDRLAIDEHGLGSLALATGEVDAAIPHLRAGWDAIRPSRPRSVVAMLILRDLALARIAQADLPRARAAAERGIQIYDDLRPDIAADERAHAGAFDTARQLVWVLLHVTLGEGWMDETIALMEAGKARFWVEAVRRSAAAQAEEPEPPSITDRGPMARLAGAAGYDTLVLAFFVGPESTFVAWTFNGMAGGRRLDIRPRDLQALVEEHRFELMGTPGRGPASDRAARELAALLLGAVPEDLRPRMAIVMPDGPLWAVPFEALPVPAWGDTLLGARTPVMVCPSIAALEELRAREHDPPWRPLVVGDPSGGVEVPGTLRQLAAIRRVLRKRTREGHWLWGSTATRERVLAAAEDATHIHIAAHAVGSIEDVGPYILLGTAEGAPDPLQLSDLEAVRLRADLVTLSACSTMLGLESTGEGMMSMARAFLFAGARCVVGTLWEISDDDAVRLMRRFYEELVDGATAAVALKTSREEARAAGVQPRSWAAFQLIGDGDSWRARARMAA